MITKSIENETLTEIFLKILQTFSRILQFTTIFQIDQIKTLHSNVA